MITAVVDAASVDDGGPIGMDEERGSADAVAAVFWLTLGVRTGGSSGADIFPNVTKSIKAARTSLFIKLAAPDTAP